jgi:hypothetical protein
LGFPGSSTEQLTMAYLVKKISAFYSTTLCSKDPNILVFFTLKSINIIHPGVKRQMRDTNRSPPSTAKVKNTEAISPLLRTHMDPVKVIFNASKK